jgi:hypothetical protein
MTWSDDRLSCPPAPFGIVGTLSVLCTMREMLRLPLANMPFGVSLPAPSADALSATLYGHSSGRPLSRAER